MYAVYNNIHRSEVDGVNTAYVNNLNSYSGERVFWYIRRVCGKFLSDETKRISIPNDTTVDYIATNKKQRIEMECIALEVIKEEIEKTQLFCHSRAGRHQIERF